MRLRRTSCRSVMMVCTVCLCLRPTLRGFFGDEEHVFEAYCADSIISSIHG